MRAIKIVYGGITRRLRLDFEGLTVKKIVEAFGLPEGTSLSLTVQP
jgi:hypothetical protein